MCVVSLDELVGNVHVSSFVPNDRIGIGSALDNGGVTMLLRKGLQKGVNLLCNPLEDLL